MTTHTIISASAIDLGFFSTKIASPMTGAGSTSVKTQQFPSLAPISTPMQDLPSFNRPDGCTVTVADVTYFVGSGVHQRMDGSGLTRSSNPDYSRTPEYKALFLGALWHLARSMQLGDTHLKLEHLAVGLPMASMRSHAKFLSDLCSGSHLIPGVADPASQFKVTIGKVHVLSQPQGAMLSMLGTTPSASQENILVADMGGGTFDWFLAERMVANLNKSGSHNRGMLNCSIEICKRIAPDSIGNPGMIQRIDDALREEAPSVKVAGQQVDLADSLPYALQVVESSLRQMALSIGDMGTIDRVIVAGGGAHLITKAWANVFPRYTSLLDVCDDPVYANVRGFLLYARSAAANLSK
jgi:PRTRC genetic system protein D